MNLKKNLAILGSPWHAIILKSIMTKSELQETYVVLEYSTKSTIEAIQSILKISDYLYINWVDFEVRHNIKSIFSSPFKLNQRIIELKEFFYKKNFSKIYFSNPNSPSTRIIIESTNYDECFRIEDGICDYIPFQIYPELKPHTQVVKSIYLGLNNSKKYYKRVQASELLTADHGYFFFPEKINIPKSKKIIDLNEVKDNILSTLRSGCPIIKEINEAKMTALFIGQTLFEDKACSIEDEILIYLETIRYLIDIGYNQIYFKSHPRSNKDKLNLLKERTITFNRKFILLDNPQPIESILSNHNFHLIIGAWSNPILLARRLFSTESYSILPILCREQKYNVSSKIKNINSYLVANFSNDYLEFKII